MSICYPFLIVSYSGFERAPSFALNVITYNVINLIKW